MSDHDAMLRAVVNSPEDDTARLAYADAVQESGDEALASLIRVGVLCPCRFPTTLYTRPTCAQCKGGGWCRRCQHEGCREPGLACVVEGTSGGERDDIEEFFCPGHAHCHGYCCGCGAFWAGIEAFDTSPSGLCPHCRNSGDFGEDEDEDWDYDGGHYPDEF